MQLQGPAEQASSGVDLVHRHGDACDLLQAVDVEPARLVEDVADSDRLALRDAGACQHRGRGGVSEHAACRPEQLSPISIAFSPP